MDRLANHAIETFFFWNSAGLLGWKRKPPMRMPHKNLFTRNLFFVLLSICLLPCFFPCAAATTMPAQLGEFPEIHATSLDGAKLHLPQDFSGQFNLVLISFAREQQHEVDTWIPVAKQIQAAHKNVSYYELPTTSRGDLLFRWWFDAALRSNTTDKDLRSRTLTAYVSKHYFQKTLRIASEKRVVAVLVDRMGKVYWRADGACTDQAKLGLQAALAANGV
jgi:hypothetical protein